MIQIVVKSNVKLDQVRTKSKFSAEAPRNLCKIKCACDKFPMEEGEWQHRVYKMLTEIKDIITTGNQDSRIVKSSDVDIKMNSVEDVNDFNK